MSQFKEAFLDIYAYWLYTQQKDSAFKKVSDRIDKLMLIDMQSRLLSGSRSGDCDKCKPRYKDESISLDKLKECLKGTYDPRYIRNPLYSLKKHRENTYHKIFDELKPSEIP